MTKTSQRPLIFQRKKAGSLKKNQEESFEQKRKRALAIVRRLRKMYPHAKCALEFSNPWELLVATILSAQCTDERVNQVTRRLFKKYRTIQDYANVPLSELEKDIHSTGFYKNKARNIQQAARQIIERFGGKVPQRMEDLVSLPGVGRKTANVVLGNAFHIPGLVVDTHMVRINRLLGLTKATDPVKIEFDLMKLIPKKEWTLYSHRIIQHGRSVCKARRPQCSVCGLRELCPSAK